MSALKTHPQRPLWRACLAIFAIVANLVLPAALSHAAPLSTGFGDSFSICLANGNNSAPPAAPGSDAPGSAALHCSVCFYAGVAAPTGGTGLITVLGNQPILLSAGYSDPAFAADFLTRKFEARAPPA